MKKTLLLIGLFISICSYSQEQIEYFNKGQKKYDAGDYYGAIYEYTKSIESGDFYPPSLTNRALAKAKIGDLPSAYEDINLVIEIVPKFGATYFYRGLIKLEHSRDYYGAISDFMKAIELDDGISPKGRYQLGLAKEKIGDIIGACKDWRTAAELGNPAAAKLINDKCN